MLEIKDLTFAYPRCKQPVFSDLSLDIRQGGVYGLLGPNGAGKSTLLYLIGGLLTAKHGTVRLFGDDVRLRHPATLAEMFIVPEEFDLPKIRMSKYANIYSKYYPRFSMDDLKAHLSTFDLEMGMNLGEVSMGQKKKAFMAFALATNTRLLIMDEPTNGLDIPGKIKFRSFIAANMTDEKAIIISTHQVRDINQLLDHVIIMDDKHILLNMSMTEIASRLKFEVTTDPTAIANALYKMPGIQGANIVSYNDAGVETPVDLELLFQLITENPNVLNQQL